MRATENWHQKSNQERNLVNSEHWECGRCARLSTKGQCEEANSIQIQPKGRVRQSEPPNKRNRRDRVQASHISPDGLFVGSAKDRSRVDHPRHGAQCLRVRTSCSYWLGVDQVLGFPQLVHESTLRVTMSMTPHVQRNN